MNRGRFILGIFFFVILFNLNPAENLVSTQALAQRGQVPGQARKEYIVTIQGDFAEDKMLTWLNPRQLRIGRGNEVTWINESKNEVRIKFGKGEACREVSLKALGWNLEPGKCYVTKDSLKFKETVTVRFRDVGLYLYEIEFVDKDRKESGTIHVQTEDR